MGNGFYDELEKVLLLYGEQSTDCVITLKDIMDELEYQISSLTYEDDQKVRVELFCTTLFENRIEGNGMVFMVYSVLNYIDKFIEKQIEHHGFHILAAQEILNDPEMLENSEYWLNSAHPKDVATVEYYQNLLACQTLWRELSAEARQKAEEMCFPLPVRV